VQQVQTRHTLALWLVACQPSSVAHTTFGGASDVTAAASSGAGSTTSAGTSTGSEGGSGGGSADTMPGPVSDLGGMPDFGDTSPVGCKGKIDFLFVISRSDNMGFRQEQLALAVPQFIDTIQSKFADFDYHIMVVTGDDWWGSDICESVCPDLSCKIGDSCCDGGGADKVGQPCCASPDYPCDKQDLVTTCDWLWGAGEVFPAGNGGASNKPCPVEGGRRYLVKGQTDLKGTFECIARVGSSGWGALGQALAAAVQHNLNGPGGCNGGFLRDEALLMVTFVATNPDQPGTGSKGTPAEWAQAVIDAKHGDDKSVVMFNIGAQDCAPDDPDDRLCVVTRMFPFHHLLDVLVADWGPGFAQAASLVETACAGFTPPPG
jgi:hypothetical protein